MATEIKPGVYDMGDQKSACPSCGYVIEAATSSMQIEGNPEAARSPKKNDIILCAKCADILQYNKDLKVEKVTEEELRILFSEIGGLKSYVKKIQEQILYVRSKNSKKY